MRRFRNSRTIGDVFVSPANVGGVSDDGTVGEEGSEDNPVRSFCTIHLAGGQSVQVEGTAAEVVKALGGKPGK